MISHKATCKLLTWRYGWCLHTFIKLQWYFYCSVMEKKEVHRRLDDHNYFFPPNTFYFHNIFSLEKKQLSLCFRKCLQSVLKRCCQVSAFGLPSMIPPNCLFLWYTVYWHLWQKEAMKSGKSASVVCKASLLNLNLHCYALFHYFCIY